MNIITKIGRITVNILILFTCIVNISAQEGDPFISNFTTNRIIDKQVFDIGQDQYHVMLFATRKGILTFDSEDWKLIVTPDIALTIARDSASRVIYIGCNNDFGRLDRDATGQYHYTSLSGMLYVGEITRIVQTQQHIYFFSNNRITRIVRNNPDDFFYMDTEAEEYFSGIFTYRNRVFISSTRSGLYELKDSVLAPFQSNIDLKSHSILFSIPFNNQNILIGTSNNDLFLFNGQAFQPLSISDQEYLVESELAGGISINQDYFAVSTVLGGCMVIQKKTGNVENIINYRTGLPDDEIYAIGMDINKGIWLSHEYGLSRIDLFIPVKNYSTYPGISGNFVSSTIFNDQLYISTNDGVYCLNEKKDYVEKEIIVEVKPEPLAQPAPEEIKTEKEVKQEEETEQPKQELSKREQRKLKREQRKEEQQIQEEQQELTDQKTKEEPAKEKQDFITKLSKAFEKPFKKTRETAPEEEQRSTFKKQKIYSLQSISHEFIKIPGISGKANQLVNIGNRLLATTRAGLYEITSHQAKVIFPDWFIEFIEPSLSQDKAYVATNEKVYLIGLENNKWKIIREFNEIPDDVYSICETSATELWFGGDNVVYKLNPVSTSEGFIPFVISDKSYDPVFLKSINNRIYLFLSSGIYTLENDTVRQVDFPITRLSALEYRFCNNEVAWIKDINDWFSIDNPEIYNTKLNNFLNLFDDIQSIDLDNSGNLWIIHNNTRIDKILSSKINDYTQVSYLHLTQIANQEGDLYNLGTLTINYSDRSLEFNFTAPGYLKPRSNQYKYFIDGLSEQWSPWRSNSVISFPVIPPGRYLLRYRVKNILGMVFEEQVLQFQIKPPFWFSWWFIGLSSLALIGIVLLIIRLRVRKLEYDKKILEDKVIERTAEIERQKNEIATQKQEIMDSIHYARRIQSAVLPKTTTIDKILPENFILYLPRDIVSGDFYWMTRQQDIFVFAAADCTGHGVPGAFMSMLGVSFLNEIISKEKNLKADEILNRLRNLVKSTLSQSDEGESKDGMDIALCILNHKTLELQYSGAFNPLYLIRNAELNEYRADRMPIGIYPGRETNFTNHEIKLQKGDCIYVFSDGYIDQIGGEKGKKFLSKTFKQLVLEIHDKPMAEQHEVFRATLTKWMGKFQQVDDILLIGIRV